MKGNEGPIDQNEKKWRLKRPKWKEIEAQKAKMKGNEASKGQNEKKWKDKGPKGQKGNKGPKGQNERKWKPKRPKWKEMKAQKAKMTENESSKGQNDGKWRPKRPKWTNEWRPSVLFQTTVYYTVLLQYYSVLQIAPRLIFDILLISWHLFSLGIYSLLASICSWHLFSLMFKLRNAEATHPNFIW